MGKGGGRLFFPYFILAILSRSCNIHRASSAQYQKIRRGEKLIFQDMIPTQS